MTQPGDGVDEVVGGAVRVGVTVAGQAIEQRQRAQEARRRDEQARALAETQRLGAREGATAAAVVAADVAREKGWDSPARREALEERLSSTVHDSDAVAARLHVDRSQATPPEAAVAPTPAKGGKARSTRSRTAGKDLERGR